ncbi:MAG: universal stress protein [Cyclobacteriaceae bacterium]|nr:universal stress protein [Cyclobacteriaceae bacterium]
MKKVLCPTDFSATADNGIAYAAKLAHRTGSHLDLLHVLTLVDRTPEEALLGEQLNAQMAYDRLENQCREISKVFRVSCNAHVIANIAGLSSLIENEAVGHDLIVMGTHGPGNVFEYFFGSHSYRMARQSEIPVLVVPSGCLYSDIRKTVFAFDYWRKNKLPLSQLISVLKPMESDLTILEVLEESTSRKADEEMTADQQLILDTHRHEVKLDFDTLHTGHIAAALDRYVKEKKFDVLALCALRQNFIGRLFHKSLIKEMSMIATYPLLVIHDQG